MDLNVPIDVPYRVDWGRYFTIQLNTPLSEDEKQSIFGELFDNCHVASLDSTIIKRCKALLKYSPADNSEFIDKVLIIKTILELSVTYRCTLAMVISNSSSSWATELLFVCSSDEQAQEFVQAADERAKEFVQNAESYLIENCQLPIEPA